MKQLLRVVAFMTFTSAVVQAQTVADVARKERARQKATPTRVVITNEDVKPSESVPAANEKPGNATTPPPPPAAGAADTPGGHDEKWWREQFAKTREEIQRLTLQLPVLENNLKTANFEFLTRAYDPDGRGRRAIDAATTALEEAKNNLGQATERMAKLEEDLRRAGGPAGWAR
jgi:hypothetical protein